MTIDKAVLFQTTKALWPAMVDVSDPNATYKIYRAHEEGFSQDDDWQQLALWSFHQALSVHEKRSVARGLRSLHPQKVTFAEFDDRMRSNLNGDDGWLERRAEYDSEKHP